MMHEDCLGFDDFCSSNKIKVVTLNYDRSFEYFMFNALKNTYNEDSQKIYDYVDSIIIHLHGKLPIFKKDCIDYTLM